MNSRSLLNALVNTKIDFDSRLNRRQFVKTQIKLSCYAAIGASLYSSPLPLMASDIPDIAVAQGDPGPATRSAVKALGGITAFIKPGDKVVIKPNMSFVHGPEQAANTDPLVVKELVAMCKEAKAARVRVLDHTLRPKELCIEGVKSVCEPFNEDMVHGISNEHLFKPTPIPKGVSMKQTDVMTEVLKADVLIAAPTAKSHSSAGVSLSMKGMMGLIYDRRIMHRQYDLSTAITDLASLLTPHLVVIDGTRVLSTNGPAGPGKVIHAKTVIAARDMVAADALAVQMFEWYGQKMKPSQVKHIRMAHERGLGSMDLAKQRIKRIQAT